MRLSVLALILMLTVLLSACASLQNIRFTSNDEVDYDYGYTEKFEGMQYDPGLPYAPYNHPLR